jgi:hypothetical protein
MKSLTYLLDKSMRIRSAPDLFCLDLYKDFDMYALITLTLPVKDDANKPYRTVDASMCEFTSKIGTHLLPGNQSILLFRAHPVHAIPHSGERNESD